MTERLLPATPPAPAGGWRRAVVEEVMHPTPRTVGLRLRVDDRVDHMPGQHYVVRLTADDGYTASRSYSVSSSPADPLLELFVARLDDGEVSTFLADVAAPGDELEVRGPIGGWFVWDGVTPALGVGGGTGVVPLVAMLRHAVDLRRTDLLRLAVSARAPDELPYAEELMEGGAVVAYTRSGQGSDGREPGRLMPDDLMPLVRPDATTFVCGSAQFAEAASSLLVALRVPAESIRVERFGPSG